MTRREIGKTRGVLAEGIQNGMCHWRRHCGMNGSSREAVTRFTSPSAESLPGQVGWNYQEVEDTLVRHVVGGILNPYLRWYCRLRTHLSFIEKSWRQQRIMKTCGNCEMILGRNGPT